MFSCTLENEADSLDLSTFILLIAEKEAEQCQRNWDSKHHQKPNQYQGL